MRLNVGDRILILPRFAHLYPRNLGEVVDVQLDPHREILNEYTIKFLDGSTANLFEFQIQRDVSAYQTSRAVLAFDTSQQTAVIPLRGSPPDRHLLLQTPTIDIDMKIYWIKSAASVIGQILERSSASFVADAEVTLMNRDLPASTVITDNQGTFLFSGLASGPLEIQILLHSMPAKILASVTI
jgi:hypothetical protein